MCTQGQDPKRMMGYQLNRHKSQIKDNGRIPSSTKCPTSIPSSDGTTVTTIMTHPVQVPPLQTIQINENQLMDDSFLSAGCRRAARG